MCNQIKLKFKCFVIAVIVYTIGKMVVILKHYLWCAAIHYHTFANTWKDVFCNNSILIDI